MARINDSDGRDLDLNLLRVFAVVADERSVTRAAARLYLTQPAVSAALRRLTAAVGASLFARQGRGLVLTSRGLRLRATVEPHLRALIDAALSPEAFDPRSSTRTIRLGLADTGDEWLLPPLVKVMSERAPSMRIVAMPVQFRTVGDLLASGSIDIAVTVADELPESIRRRVLFAGDFCCLYDPRHARIRAPLTEAQYFAHHHVIVSYNGDLRGVVEDLLHKTRKVRVSVASFGAVGALVEGSALLATVPTLVATRIRTRHPALRTTKLPFRLAGSTTDLLWQSALDDDEACRFVRDEIEKIAVAPPRARKAQRSR